MIDLEKLKREKPIKELIDFGIINVDKPANCTSFDVVDFLRSLFKVRKAGHFGTLDPMVTGVLPIALGKSVKLQAYFMGRDKTYVGAMKVHKSIAKTKLENEMKVFLGKIKQLPPRKSAVKREIRERSIRRFKLLTFDEKKRVGEFVAEVEAGTYIRKLISDLGERIGGAQMIFLRRIKAGLFSKDEMFSLEEIKEAFELYKKGDEKFLRQIITPAEVIIELMPYFEVKNEFIAKLKNGSPLFNEMLVDLKDKNKIDKIGDFAVISNNKVIGVYNSEHDFDNKDIIARAGVVLQ